MNRASREHGWVWFFGGLMVGGSLLGGGCTAGSPPVALEQARTAYAQAQQTPQVVTQAPVALQDAEQALRRAERVWADDKDTEEVQHLSYLTSQRVEMAKTVTEKKLAEGSIQQANQERDQVLLDARTREAQRAQGEAERATQQAQVATTQAQQLQQELAALQAKQTDAVLTQCLQAIMEALQAGESVELRGFGRFHLRHRQARAGRNPRTGEMVPIPAKAVPTFSAGKAFQEQVQPRAAAGGTA